MKYWFGIYSSFLRTSIATMLQYRFAILIWAVWGFVGPLISLAVWSAVSGARTGPVTGNNGMDFTRADFAAYFLTFMVFGHLTMSWDAFEFAFRVRDGGLSPKLMKPLHPIHSDAANNVAFKITTSSMLIPVWLLLLILLHPTPPASGLQFALALPAVVIAGIMRFVWQYALAVIAFWTTRVEAINQLYFTLDTLFGGRIAPLALLPAWMGAIAFWTPFRSMASFPVELALGRVPWDQVGPGFLMQCIWLGLGIVAFRVMWGAGVKQYSAVGA